MKILFIQTQRFSQNESGVQRITFNLGRYFTEKGLKVGYFSFKNEAHMPVEFGELFHASELGTYKNTKNLNDLKESIYYFKPDIIINQTPYTNEIKTTIKKCKTALDFKVIGCIHNSLFTFKSNAKLKLKTRYKNLLGDILASLPFRWIYLKFHDKKHRRDLIKILEANDLTLLYTPPNLEELKYFLKPEDYKHANIGLMPNPVVSILDKVPKKEKIILHVGSIKVQQKRSDLLLDFWENVYASLPDWKFQILGEGDYFQELKTDLKQRGLPRVEILGFQNPEEYYRKAAIFMMPSAYEGLPNTIIEANSYGCPVIAFNNYAALEWIVNKDENAILVKPFNTHEMAKLCVNLAKNSNKLKVMQRSALDNAKRFRIDRVGEQWIDIFKGIK